MHDGLRVRKLARGFLAVAVGNYGAMTLAFALSVVLTQRLGAERFGALALLVMAAQVLSMFAANWTHIGFIAFGSREFAASRSVRNTFWTRHLIVAPWAAIGGVVLVVFRGPIAEYLGATPRALWLVAAYFLATYSLATLGALFQAREEMGRYGTALFLEKAISLALVGLLPLGWVRDPSRVIAAYTVSSLIVCTWAVTRVGFAEVRPVRLQPDAFRRMWRYSLPLIFSTWSGLLGTNWFDLIILRRYLELADLGVYALAAQLNAVVQQVSIIFSTLLLPRMNVMVDRGDDAGIRVFVSRLLPYWFLGASLLFGAALIAARPVVPLVFGEEFASAIRPLAILMIATSALTFFNALTPILSAHGRTWELAMICFAAALVNVVADLALIPAFGLEGSAVATVLSYGLSAVLVIVLVQRVIGVRIVPMLALSLPVVGVSASFLWLDDPWFYPVGVATLAGTGYLLARIFGLGLRPDLSLVTAPVASPAAREAEPHPDPLEPV